MHFAANAFCLDVMSEMEFNIDGTSNTQTFHEGTKEPIWVSKDFNPHNIMNLGKKRPGGSGLDQTIHKIVSFYTSLHPYTHTLLFHTFP